ncbi:hypothetical protein BYT27DRAFT_7252293 [Phlegmacium glaucopus]|nr:hypothetical protein BYT27DRAFT_7252293 [Phlegmacium glaucopus]
MDVPKNTRFAINYFTSIGLGVITEEMREYLKVDSLAIPVLSSLLPVGPFSINLECTLIMEQRRAMLEADSSSSWDSDPSSADPSDPSSEDDDESVAGRRRCSNLSPRRRQGLLFQKQGVEEGEKIDLSPT